LYRFGIMKTIPKLMICGFLQVVLGIPFLMDNPIGYLSRSFNLGRVFIYYWSVNWKFIPENIFLSQPWGLILLAFTLITWFLFYNYKWKSNNIEIGLHTVHGNLSASYLTSILFCSNFIGIIFSRSLHYQFYLWYYHTLPHLLWLTPYPTPVRIILFFIIEVMWNIFPSNPGSSLILFICHLLILIGLWRSKFWSTWNKKDNNKDN